MRLLFSTFRLIIFYSYPFSWLPLHRFPLPSPAGGQPLQPASMANLQNVRNPWALVSESDARREQVTHSTAQTTSEEDSHRAADKEQLPATLPLVEDESSPFECNICLDLAKDPVVTICGHLYCWRCLYRWHSEQVRRIDQLPLLSVSLGGLSVSGHA